MQSTIPCKSCGTVLGIPKEGVPSDGVECNWCGARNHLADTQPPEHIDPATIPSQKPSKPTATDLKIPSKTQSKPKKQPHRWADDEDDDGEPYEIPEGEHPVRKCEACQKEIPKEAVLCIHCGHHRDKKEKQSREFSVIDKQWEQGWPFEKRLLAFGVCQLLNLVSLAIGIASIGQVGLSLFGIVSFSAVQAFILGTYPRLRVRRNKRGQVEMTTTWRACFVPLETKKIDWRAHEGVSVGHFDGTGIIDWFIFFNLLPLVIPAILWWWFIIRADHFFTALTIQNESPETYVYRGMEESKAKEIAQIITDASGLRLNTPL